jgi:hypothetical protein
MMVKLAFRRQQTDELKKEMFAAAAVGDYEAAAQLKKVITATESAMEEILSVAEVAATEELKKELVAAVAVGDYEWLAELKKAITAIEDKAAEVAASEELKKELAAAVAVGDYERAAQLKKAITAAESTAKPASEPRMALFDEHDERPRSPGFCRGNIRSRILGRIGKEAFSSLTHSSHDGKYDPSHGMAMEHGSKASRGPSARPPPPAAR